MASLVGGLEAGGTKFVCAVGTGPDDVRAEARFATTTPEQTIRRAIEFFTEVAVPAPLAAIGIASFGPLDLDPRSATFGFITTTPKAGWRDVDLVTPLAAQGTAVAIDTDVNAAALAEHRWGAAQGLGSVVYVTVGSGIGGGALIHGRPIHGLAHPEMGHLRLPHDRARDPFPGTCPHHGDCWEGLASGPALAARWGQPAETLPDDHPAWELEAHYLALGLANVILTLSPERVVLGGGVMARTHLYSAVREGVSELLGSYVPALSLSENLARYLAPPALGTRAGVMGALLLAQAVLLR
jgi:fructokinase